MIGNTHNGIEADVKARHKENSTTSEKPDDRYRPEPRLVRIGFGPERIILCLQCGSEAEGCNAEHKPDEEERR